MSPSPEYYLEALGKFYSSQEEEQVKQWENARTNKYDRLFRVQVHLGEKETFLILSGLIESHFNYLGRGRLFIPTLRIDTSPHSYSIFPGFDKYIVRNRSLIGEGNPNILRKLLNSDVPVEGGEFVLNNDDFVLATDSTNQDTARFEGVNIERNPWWHEGDWMWRIIPGRESPDYEKYIVVSARGLSESLHKKIPQIKIIPFPSSSLER